MTTEKPYKTIQSIHKLKYCAFKQIMLESRYDLLAEDGEVTEEELHAVWDEVLSQYSEAMGADGDDVAYYSSFKEYLLLKRKYEKTVDFIEMLSKVYVHEWMKQLLKLVGKTPKDYSIDPTDSVKYFELLKVCEERSTSLRINADIAEIGLEALAQKRKSKSEGNKPSYDSFARIENNLIIYFKVHIDFDAISLFKYCDFCRRYIEADKQMKQRQR